MINKCFLTTNTSQHKHRFLERSFIIKHFVVISKPLWQQFVNFITVFSHSCLYYLSMEHMCSIVNIKFIIAFFTAPCATWNVKFKFFEILLKIKNFISSSCLPDGLYFWIVAILSIILT